VDCDTMDVEGELSSRLILIPTTDKFQSLRTLANQ
jgi:hypothetical protein